MSIKIFVLRDDDAFQWGESGSALEKGVDNKKKRKVRKFRDADTMAPRWREDSGGWTFFIGRSILMDGDVNLRLRGASVHSPFFVKSLKFTNRLARDVFGDFSIGKSSSSIECARETSPPFNKYLFQLSRSPVIRSLSLLSRFGSSSLSACLSLSLWSTAVV